MLFNAALECAWRKWRGKCEHHGIAMGHRERLTNIRYVDDLMLYARSWPALVGMIKILSWELHHIGLQLNAAKSKIFTTKSLDHPTYVEVSQDLVHVLHEGSSHKFLGRHIPGNLRQRGRVELHHRKTIASAKFNEHRTILTNKHVSLKLRLKFFKAVFTPAMLLSLHTLALTNVHLDSINVLQRKMLRSIVGWVRVNGEDWSETMRWMNHRLSVALELFPFPPWTEQLAKRQFQFAAKIASEQSWSSTVGNWFAQLDGTRTLTVYLLANVDVHWLNGMTNCPTSQINFSHCVRMACGGQTAFLAKCAAILCFTFCGPLGLHFPHVPMGSQS